MKITDLQEIKNRVEQMRQKLNFGGTTSGYKSVDELTGGLVRGGVTLIASRPAVGGTSLVLNMVSRLAQMKEGSILIFSPQHSDREMTMRLLEIGTDIPAAWVLDGTLPPAEVTQRCEEFFRLQKSHIKIETFTYPSLSDIQYHSYSCPNLRLLVVDNLAYICKPDDMLSRNSNEDISWEPMDRILRGLKDLAWELNVPVVCTTYLHRSLENRKNKRPRMSDLKKINLPEELADQIIFLYRDSYYCLGNDEMAECIVAKSNCGKTGTVTLEWNYATGRFCEVPNLGQDSC